MRAAAFVGAAAFIAPVASSGDYGMRFTGAQSLPVERSALAGPSLKLLALVKAKGLDAIA